MSDIIQLLPDAVANQIAAGEVVQRPASAVKELIENAIDAGADKIKLIVKDAGKSMIQVIDNGCGMSVTDARLCFERHATSKIRKAEDLFAIRTMGFRGEAMASIAAIAHIELKTRRVEDELGTVIEIEGSKITDQHPEALSPGTSISVKNLFFNIPARRNFLKSNAVEMRHIIDEFQRVALAHPEIFFSLHSDGNEVYHLPAETLKQRIVHLLGNNYNQRLVPVEEETSIITINGFIGKPEFAKKTRGEQFFFVNKRFIKDPYLNHAVLNAYEEILAADSYPLYVLFIDIDPAKIDINVHPTKTEIKYEDDKAIYAILRSAIKRSLGRYNIAPTLDFDQETGFSNMISQKPLDEIQAPTINFNPDFNPFEPGYKESASKSRSDNYTSGFEKKAGIPQNWDTLYQITESEATTSTQLPLLPAEPEEEDIDINVPEVSVQQSKQFFQLHNRFIVSQIHSGFMIIDQQAAHERILFEQFQAHLEQNQGISQQSLFPQTIDLNSADHALMEEILPEIQSLGFQLRPFGKTTYIVDGIPADLGSNVNEVAIIERLLEDFKHNKSELKLNKRENLARSLAKSAAIKPGTLLDNQAMAELIDRLFACESPNISLYGKPIIITFTMSELLEKFGKN
ncbi:DNA mismatch repair endonuclease MutL [Sphingobacterium spiritivorum]|uniref:DNA mismatch repair protein MutL n=1 Tax=Sphingobacterium spiritivorum ATCC 33861 TaxID=525373 RepID=D7VKZ8_SPHSI|nr:DNA mismatch repair endonuclease MutL [Sphingobacterium spiritivorum]EFK58271.1 DNA mismatch repair domain protein [Sphingobacterium spiritivorum ATCC 33861]QQT37029.1 DNA mismatch repair endonuclease MutL [Sphingobacterium spiritivorum]WQD33797.1 DNA mismatch repair endonuclease MutL [Sphingobacterium spiritivorum]SUJ27276.1 DNA mismatch repair protein mutL [Sphingobacterium spiritivorum]